MVSTTSDLSSETDLPVIPAPRAAECPLHPSAEFARWRDEPGLRRVIYHGRPAWVVSRYQDIKAALVDPRLSAQTIPEALLPTGTDDDTPVMFARTDDPEHHRLRRMMTGVFTLRRTDAMRSQIQDMVDEYLDAMIMTGPPADLVRDFALPVPSLVIALLLGVPPEDLEFFQHNTTVGMDMRSSDEQKAQAFGAMYTYIQELVLRKEHDPGDDLISRLVTEYVVTGQLNRATTAVTAVVPLDVEGLGIFDELVVPVACR